MSKMEVKVLSRNNTIANLNKKATIKANSGKATKKIELELGK